jgi:hypothetical protein
MKNIFILICGLVMSSGYADIAYGDKTDTLTVKYDILVESETIGDLTHKWFRNGNRSSLYERSRINASGWWGKIDISGFLVEELDGVNRLVHSESVDRDGNTLYRATIETSNEGLQASFIELKKINDSEREQFIRLLRTVSKTQEKQPENLRALTAALFKQRGKLREQARFDASDFDTTENNLPFYIQSLGGKPIPKQLRLLTTDNLAVSEVTITDLGYETISVGAKVFRCRHIKLDDGKYKPSHLWIDEESRSQPYMVRFTGEDEDGPLEINFKE